MVEKKVIGFVGLENVKEGEEKGTNGEEGGGESEDRRRGGKERGTGGSEGRERGRVAAREDREGGKHLKDGREGTCVNATGIIQLSHLNS